jgi:hypothetical protein
MVLKGLASSNTRRPTLMFCSIHVPSWSRLLCVQCLQPICEQTKHMNNQVKVEPKTFESYTTIIKALAEKCTKFHTYKLKEDA